MDHSIGIVPRPEKIILKRHPELYFDNGDIVLQASLPSKQGERVLQIYCVHMAILSFHSVFFSHLFADGSAGLAPIPDGRSVVDMPDDAEDISHLLSYVYKLSEHLLRPSHPDTPIELRGAVKLADKYVFDNARADMIKRVTMDWPVTLDEWDIRASEVQGLKRVRIALADRMPEPISAIIFAQEHECTEILPAAFYRLASIDVTAEWREDRNGPHALARWSLCDKPTLFRYIKGRQALEAYHREVAQTLGNGAMLSKHCLPGWLLDTSTPDGPDEHDVKEHPCLHFLWTLCDMEWGLCLLTTH